MSSTASSALLPLQGAPAECAVLPVKVNIAEMIALLSTPYLVAKFDTAHSRADVQRNGVPGLQSPVDRAMEHQQ